MSVGLRVVFDGNNTAYRANCVTELYTKSGERTSALIGTLNIIHSSMENLIKKYDLPIKEVIFAWDKGHAKRRTQLFPEYKGNRNHEKTEEEKQWMSEFITQANILYEKLPLFGVKCLRHDGWEADDLIYGCIHQLRQKHPDDIAVVVSTDEDFHQLISGGVDLYSPVKGVLYSLDNYQELMGIPQELFLTYKILKGDSSDNISGIPGIGEKTAKTLVNEYGNLGQILSQTNREALMKSKRTARIFSPEGLSILSRNNQLINLKDYVDLTEVSQEINDFLEDLPFVDTRAAKEFLMRYQLTSVLVKWNFWIQSFEEITSNFD